MWRYRILSKTKAAVFYWLILYSDLADRTHKYTSTYMSNYDNNCSIESKTLQHTHTHITKHMERQYVSSGTINKQLANVMIAPSRIASLQLPLPLEGFGPPSNKVSWAPQVHTQTAVRPFLQCSLLWLTDTNTHTDRLTDHALSAATGHIYAHAVHAVRPSQHTHTHTCTQNKFIFILHRHTHTHKRLRAFFPGQPG